MDLPYGVPYLQFVCWEHDVIWKEWRWPLLWCIVSSNLVVWLIEILHSLKTGCLHIIWPTISLPPVMETLGCGVDTSMIFLLSTVQVSYYFPY